MEDNSATNNQRKIQKNEMKITTQFENLEPFEGNRSVQYLGIALFMHRDFFHITRDTKFGKPRPDPRIVLFNRKIQDNLRQRLMAAAESLQIGLDESENEWIEIFKNISIDCMMNLIKEDLLSINISHDVFTSENFFSIPQKQPAPKTALGIRYSFQLRFLSTTLSYSLSPYFIALVFNILLHNFFNFSFVNIIYFSYMTEISLIIPSHLDYIADL